MQPLRHKGFMPSSYKVCSPGERRITALQHLVCVDCRYVVYVVILARALHSGFFLLCMHDEVAVAHVDECGFHGRWVAVTVVGGCVNHAGCFIILRWLTDTCFLSNYHTHNSPLGVRGLMWSSRKGTPNCPTGTRASNIGPKK